MQSQVGLKTVEVAILVQQLMAVFNAKCGDNAVDGFADREALLAQCQVVLRGSEGQFSATRVKDRELQQILFESTKLSLAYNPL